MVDISFLLPTLRDRQKYADRVIESVKLAAQNSTAQYEILVSSGFEVLGDNVYWIEDKHKIGALNAFNQLAKMATGTYIATLVDDHTVDPDFFSVIDFLEGSEFCHRRYKIATVSSGGRCPIPNHSPFNTDPARTDWLYNQTTMRFPVVHRNTIKYEMNGYLFHPDFLNSHADIYLGYWLGINGEPGLEYYGTRMREFEHLHNASRESDLHDEGVCVRLMNRVKKGDKYV